MPLANFGKPTQPATSQPPPEHQERDEHARQREHQQHNRHQREAHLLSPSPSRGTRLACHLPIEPGHHTTYQGAILAPLVEPHPPPSLHSSSLYCGVGVLEPEPQRVVVRVLEVSIGLTLEGGDLVRDVGQLAGYVSGDVGVVPGPGVWVLALAHPLRIRQGQRIT
jgi:hypothetical protein